MRITTQMMNASAKRAGISLGGTTLLNYVNGMSCRNAQSSLLQVQSQIQPSKINKESGLKFEKLQQEAEQLSDSIERFLQEGEKSILGKEDVDEKELFAAVDMMVKNYNGTIKTLKTMSGPLNDFYRKMLEETAEESKDALQTIGIVVNENQTLGLDKDKIQGVEIETIRKALGGSGTFSAKAAFVGRRIADNARVNTESFSNLYGIDGYMYSINSSKYDFLG